MPKAVGTLNSYKLRRQPYQLDDSLHYDIQWGNISRQQKSWRVDMYVACVQNVYNVCPEQ